MSTLGLMWANLFRRKVRTFLTLFSVLVAFLLFTMLRTVVVAFDGGVTVDGADRLVVAPKFSIVDPLPITQRQQILALEGVDGVTHQTWFGGSYQDPSNFFPKFPVEPKQFFEIYREFEISPEHLEAFERTRTGALATPTMMAKFGWQIGDKIPIGADIYPMRDNTRLWEFDLVGSYSMRDEDIDPGMFLFNYAFFDEARLFGEGTVGWYTVRLSDPDRAGEISSAIDALFLNSTNPTKTATEDEFAKNFSAQVGDIGLMMTGILTAVFFTILLLTANTMSQALRERIPELAVLKTLGFSDGTVALVVLGESILLCAFGGMLGIALAVVAFPGIKENIPPMFGVFELSGGTIAVGMGLAVLLGLVVGVLPAWTANRLKIVDALRKG